MATPYRTPSLNSLLVFESAARHGSFTHAAAELHISQPAVSHAIRLLEAELGVRLFERRHKGVQATEAGRYLLEQVGLGLTLIDQAVREVRNLTERRQVSLAISTATATWWMLPRVARFKQAHPDIELRCITTDTDPDLEREGIDLAIPLGAGDWPRHRRWHFVDEEIFPVCSPDYLHRHPLERPDDLTEATLLHLEEHYRPRLDWAGWLARFGVHLTRGARRFSFNDYSIVIQAALEGQGVALGWHHIVAPLIDQGRLVRPLPQIVRTDHPLYLIATRSAHLSPAALALRDWLIAEAQAETT